ncbi:zinc finger protein-domain-containing protein [Cercophora scortea]|uniref:Zinc finger protein-domain-containing protein n=1 Tax=Cercophora scortea TaxID=314031 RepID=A0AAE0IWV3_9PEZI|nr:zinc finger protein-domain-containing protein [Cercophora scortea]
MAGRDRISTSSSITKRHAKAQAEGQIAFRKIGAGACGSVFAQDGKSFAVKLAKSPDHAELWNDYQMHEEIAHKFHRHTINEVRDPECYFFVPSDKKSFWGKHPGLLNAAKDVCNLPAAALLTERIMPLPSATRELLIDKYCAPSIKGQARADPANSDCLVRVYLGSTQGKIGGRFFSLRNFKLHLNHMLDLELDTGALARRMGSALAVLHWGAKTDARDVEFVLGSSTKKTMAAKPIPAKDLKPFTYTGPPTDEIDDFFCRVTELFVLDFNQVRTITMDAEGVATAVEAWLLNDPYYPKPLGQTAAEQSVWEAFRISYLTASHEVMSPEGYQGMVLALPRKFILGITELEQKKTLSRKAEGPMMIGP